MQEKHVRPFPSRFAAHSTSPVVAGRSPESFPDRVGEQSAIPVNHPTSPSIPLGTLKNKKWLERQHRHSRFRI